MNILKSYRDLGMVSTALCTGTILRAVPAVWRDDRANRAIEAKNAKGR